VYAPKREHHKQIDQTLDKYEEEYEDNNLIVAFTNSQPMRV
jgi:hypothetical protein